MAKVEAIHRGWSTDLKFKVTKNQETFFANFSTRRVISQTTRISIYQKVAALGFPSSKPFYVHLFLKVNKDTCY